MKLNEIFDDRYYDEIQMDLKRRREPNDTPSWHEPAHDTETSMQDFIISQFEAGDLTYEQALQKLKEVTPKDQMFFWKHELAMADELLKDQR
jgi:hypothetical protein